MIRIRVSFFSSSLMQILCNKLSVAICMGGALVLQSCNDYSSPVPLSNPAKAVIDSAYVGSWQFIPSGKEAMPMEKFNQHSLDVFTFNEHEYVARMYNTEGDQVIARVFLSRIGHSDFANVQLLDFRAYEYFLYKLQLEADTLWYYPIEKDSFSTQFKKPKNLRKALEKALEERSIFGHPRKYLRVHKNKLF